MTNRAGADSHALDMHINFDYDYDLICIKCSLYTRTIKLNAKINFTIRLL